MDQIILFRKKLKINKLIKLKNMLARFLLLITYVKKIQNIGTNV